MLYFEWDHRGEQAPGETINRASSGYPVLKVEAGVEPEPITKPISKPDPV